MCSTKTNLQILCFIWWKRAHWLTKEPAPALMANQWQDSTNLGMQRNVRAHLWPYCPSHFGWNRYGNWQESLTADWSITLNSTNMNNYYMLIYKKMKKWLLASFWVILERRWGTAHSQTHVCYRSDRVRGLCLTDSGIPRSVIFLCSFTFNKLSYRTKQHLKIVVRKSRVDWSINKVCYCLLHVF